MGSSGHDAALLLVSKCLVAGFRIGWVAAGKHARRIQQLQLMSTLSTSSPMQLALVDYRRPNATTPIFAACDARWPSVNSRRGSHFCAICRRASKSIITTAATFVAGASGTAGCRAVKRTGVTPSHQYCPARCFPPRCLDTFFRFNTSGMGRAGRAGRYSVRKLISSMLK